MNFRPYSINDSLEAQFGPCDGDPKIWLLNTSAPFRGIMKFFLVYNGPLSASGNHSKKRSEVVAIREEFSRQLRELWSTSRALEQLQLTAFRKNEAHPFWTNVYVPEPTLAEIYQRQPDALVPLWGDIGIGDFQFRPLVRESLHLNCELKILFLRQGDPGDLYSQGGDLDNRVKTLLDALRLPTDQEIGRDNPEKQHTFCLMESDTLVCDLDIETDRLLFPKTEFPNEVHLVIEVELRLLRVLPETICLL